MQTKYVLTVLVELTVVLGAVLDTTWGHKKPVNEEDAFMIKCKASRIGTMSSEAKVSTIHALRLHDGHRWEGQPLHDGRVEYFYKLNFESSERCHFICKTQCLMPAASYGFDAATCKVINPENKSWCISGYTPDELNVCHGSEGFPCNDRCPNGWEGCVDNLGVENCWQGKCFLFKKYRDDYLLRPRLDDLATPEVPMRFEASKNWHLDETKGHNEWLRYKHEDVKPVPRWNQTAIKEIEEAGLKWFWPNEKLTGGVNLTMGFEES